MKDLGAWGTGVALGVGAALALGVAYGANSLGGAQSSGVSPELDRFAEAFAQVRSNYVREVSDGELAHGAISGMVTSLDPQSSYLTEKEYQALKEANDTPAASIGVDITLDHGVIEIIAPIDGSPAANAGLRAGDYIVAMDGVILQDLSLDEAIAKFRGPAGSKVRLTIGRKNADKPIDVTLTRAVVRVPNVQAHAEGDVGYIRVRGFGPTTQAQVQAAVHQLKSQMGANLRGYVLDLRNNAGGLVEPAVAVADDFLSSGEVLSTRGRENGETRHYTAHSGDIIDGKPLEVLINEGSASGAEIIAGALQDNRRATVIGTPSFGLGSIQTIIPLTAADGGALRLTTSTFYTPAGHEIQGKGIKPDIQVAQESAKEAALADLPRDTHATQSTATNTPSAAILRPPAGKTYPDFQLTYALAHLNGVAIAADTTPAPVQPR